MKTGLLKSMLLLFALMLSTGSAVADTTVKWVKVAPTELVDGDVVAIVDTTTCSAMANNPNEGKAPSATSVTLNTNKDQIDTSEKELADNLQWTVVIPEEGKLQFKKDDTNFLFARPNNADTDSLLVGAADGEGDVNTFQLVKDQANNQADFLYAKMGDGKDYYVGVTTVVYILHMWGVRPSINEDISSTVVTFFKKVESEKGDVNIIFEQDHYEFDLDGGSTFTSPIATIDPEGKTVTYSSDNTYVAVVDASTGEVTVKRRGTAVITASFAGDDDFDATSASYTLRVDQSNADGGMNNPIPASDAYDGIVNGSLASGTAYFIKGVVSQIGSSNDILSILSAFIDIPGMDSSGDVTYYISDNGSSAEGVKQLEVTAGRGLANAELKAMRNICVGDEVIVVGQVSNSSSTPAYSIGSGSGSDSESEKTPKVDKGNFLYKYTPRIEAPDTEVYIGTSQKISDMANVSDKCEVIMAACEPEISLSNDIMSYPKGTGKLNANEEGTDTITISCPFKVNSSDADTVFVTKKKFYVTVKSRNVEPVGQVPGFFELVTDASSFTEKDSLLIVATTDDKSYALSTTGAIMGGMSGKEVTIEEDGTIKAIPDGATSVKLKAIEGNKWAINTVENKYLYTSFNAGEGFDISTLIGGDPTNKLRHGEIAGEIGDSAHVAISIDADGLATITMHGDSIMRYVQTSMGSGTGTGTGGSGDSGSTGGSTSTSGSSTSSVSMSAFNCSASDATDGVLVKIYRFRPVPYFDITVGPNGWYSLVSAQDVKLPEDLKGYTVKRVDKDKSQVLLSPVKQIKADHPYILRGKENTTYSLETATDVEAPTDNLLKISTKSTEDGVYVLDTDNDKPVFYQWNDALLGSGHVYLDEGVSDAKELAIIIPGDANCDGEMNIADIVVIVTNMMKETPSEDFIIEAADANSDGKADQDDIPVIVNTMMDD